MNAQAEFEMPCDNVGSFSFPWNPEKWDKSWISHATLTICSVSEIRGMLRRHYLGDAPAVNPLAIRLSVDGVPIGCIVFSLPPRETCQRYGGCVWELSRLFVLDQIPRNVETWFISQSVKYVKKTHPEVQLLVSYSDPSVGHLGGVYRASNWRVDGITDEGRKTPRFDYIEDGVRMGRASHCRNPEKVRRSPKLRFVMQLKP